MAAGSERTRQTTGAMGEDYAAAYLRDKGYQILEVNFRVTRPRSGEVDIIAVKECFLVFVEVKTRKRGSLASAQWTVSKAQQKRIISAAEVFLYRYSIELQPRFDVICLETTPTGEPFQVLSVEHYESAFWMQ